MGRPRLCALDERDCADGAAPRAVLGSGIFRCRARGGLLLALGFFTPIASALLVAQSTYIVVRAHLPRGFWNSGGGIEFPLQLLAGSLLVVASGPGAIAIDPALGVDLGVWWRAGSLAVAVVGALIAMAIARPRPQPQVQPQTPSP